LPAGIFCGKFVGMTEGGKTFSSLRSSRFENERLIFALLLSLAVHLAAFGGYEVAKGSGWLQRLHRVAKVQPVPLPVEKSEEPLEFVTVEQPSAEPPKNAKYYSSQNSRAANPDAEQNSATPKLNGKQTDVPKTEDTPRMKLAKAQPASPAQPPSQSPPTPSPGDLILGKPDNSQQLQPEKPRTVREARAQNQLPGLQMRQNGGVPKQLISSLDVTGSPLGQYDELIIEAVQQRWDDLLDSRQFAEDRSGRVTLRFHLNYDGTVSDMTVLNNTVGELLSLVCQDAIEEAAPFAAWPGEMHRTIGANYREITFTFLYY
jgi:hypothetical protein